MGNFPGWGAATKQGPSRSSQCKEENKHNLAHDGMRNVVQGDTSGCDEPPVDFKSKVPFWPNQARADQAKTELLF